ncbi:hypothetical protein [Winogradskyella sp.]|uniref:hypothetical protein n=1 Tax=Winogradskyella sp. TaxID=1883156 RepID=UPI00263237D4|nr:hypothetical protein [Winogradskyella sp.]
MNVFKFLIFVCIISNGNAQEDVALNFPNDVLGSYKGDLVIRNPKGTQSIGMEFNLHATDSIGYYDYQLVYIADGKRQERNYNLIVKDAEKGEYLIDENNGIVLGANFYDNTLYSVFEVESSLLTTIETFYKDRMEFKIIFSNLKEKTTNESSEDTPEVSVYPVTVVQKAILMKQ